MNPIGLADPSLFRQQAFIGGRWRDAANRATLSVENPSTGDIVGVIPDCGAEETADAIAAAEGAFASWKTKPAADRAATLER